MPQYGHFGAKSGSLETATTTWLVSESAIAGRLYSVVAPEVRLSSESFLDGLDQPALKDCARSRQAAGSRQARGAGA